MLSSRAGILVFGGMFNSINPIHHTFRGIDLLMEWVATGAFYDSDELYDAPNECRPHTPVDVLDEIMHWVVKSELVRDDFILWLFGPVGSGKSAIAKKIAELAADKDQLIATFFFSRTSSTRSTKARLVATLAYQLALSIPGTRPHIEAAVERDPAIFKKNIQTQIDTLLIKPYQSGPTQISPFPKLIIIDGLDECKDNRAQVAILDSVSRSFSNHRLPIIFLIVSRPEPAIFASFNRSEPLKYVHRRLSLNHSKAWCYPVFF